LALLESHARGTVLRGQRTAFRSKGSACPFRQGPYKQKCYSWVRIVSYVVVVCCLFEFPLFDETPRGGHLLDGRTSMNQNQFGALQQPHPFHGSQHREIGLRAVAAAVLYQGSHVERTISRELSMPAVSTTPVGDPKP
jgi:hypothetical protein